MKKYYYFLPLLLIMACTSLEEHANTLQQTLSLINFEYKEFVCDYQVYDIADCYVTKSTGEIFVFTCFITTSSRTSIP